MSVLTIDVTAEHIANGRRFSERTCPIACAINETLPDNQFVRVERDRIFLCQFPDDEVICEKRLERYLISKMVTDFTLDFDFERETPPFTLVLDTEKRTAKNRVEV